MDTPISSPRHHCTGPATAPTRTTFLPTCVGPHRFSCCWWTTAKPAPFAEAASAAEAEQATEPAPAVEEVHSNLLTAADIHIAPGVDTTNTPTLDAINCLRRFFIQKMVSEPPSDYWYAPDMEDYGEPYPELRYAEFDSVGRYRPTVLEARPAREGEILLKVMWNDEPGTLDLPTARYAFEFLVRSTAEGTRLSLPLEHNTASWERRTVGPITNHLAAARLQPGGGGGAADHDRTPVRFLRRALLPHHYTISQ